MSLLSIYVSAFNLENGLFDWKESLDKMYSFADELVIGTTTDSNDNTIKLLDEYTYDKKKCILAVTDFSLKDPLFDGKIKNAALQNTTLPYKCLLDLDEEIPISQRKTWIDWCGWMGKFDVDCLMIPSINLCKDKYHYKDIGYKFYLHRNGLHRGVIKYAKNEFTDAINIKISDTTEILNDLEEVPSRTIKLSNSLEDIKNEGIPYVFHKWAVDIDKRIAQNRFWKPVWECRAGRRVDDILLFNDEIKKIEVFEHGLPLE